MFHQPTVYYVWFGLCQFLVSFIVSYAIYPFVLRMARVWKFYDNPDARKLQRQPVPVLGGLGIFCAICLTSLILLTIDPNPKIALMLLAMGVLLAVGMIDDRRSMSVNLRFAIEISVITLIIILNGNYIDTFAGLWGVWHLNRWLSLALSVFAGVGIVNAVNLIDGVDGYSSLYVLCASLAFACIFYLSYIPDLAILCLISAGSLLPFFLHNVFGKKTKMFIGDSGTLMMGMMLTVFCFSILKDDSNCYTLLFTGHNVGLIPLTVAILSICIFDTLRVMTARILSGKSPFHPDKTHLHHLFIDLGFSHIGTTLSIIFLNYMVVLGWFVSWLLGADIHWQLYTVLLLSLTNTVLLYHLLRAQAKSNGIIYRAFRHIGTKTHWQDTSFWQRMQKLVDGELFAKGKV